MQTTTKTSERSIQATASPSPTTKTGMLRNLPSRDRPSDVPQAPYIEHHAPSACRANHANGCVQRPAAATAPEAVAHPCRDAVPCTVACGTGRPGNARSGRTADGGRKPRQGCRRRPRRMGSGHAVGAQTSGFAVQAVANPCGDDTGSGRAEVCVTARPSPSPLLTARPGTARCQTSYRPAEDAKTRRRGVGDAPERFGRRQAGCVARNPRWESPGHAPGLSDR